MSNDKTKAKKTVDKEMLHNAIRNIAIELETKHDWRMDLDEEISVAENPDIIGPGESFYDVAMKHLLPLLKGKVVFSHESKSFLDKMELEIRDAAQRMEAEADKLNKLSQENT